MSFPPLPPFKLIAGLTLLGLVACGGALAGYLAPYPYEEQHREHPHAPPTRIHFDGFGRAPYVHASAIVDYAQKSYVEDRGRQYPLRFLAGGRPFISVDEPARIFLLGTDGLGRDIFSRLLYGARLSLAIAGLSLLISLPLALLVGSLAGYYGGAVDFIGMRLIELLLALPAIYLIISLRSALPLDLEPGQVTLAMVGCLTLFGWATLARLTRGVVLSLRERDFVTAAMALGATDRRIIFRHIMPQLTGFMLVQASLAAPGFMLAEVTLSYLGLGIPEPLPSWGNMLASAGEAANLAARWWSLAPAAAIFMTTFAFHLLADALGRIFDPRVEGMEAQRNAKVLSSLY